MNDPLRDFFAVCPPGLEPWVADELRALGCEPACEEGGCVFRGDDEILYRANLHLRIASRVLVRVASFHVAHFAHLEQKVLTVPWATLLPRGAALDVEAVCHRSKLYHEKAVAERVAGFVAKRTGARAAADGDAAQTIHVRIVANECTLSLDSSGELLHRRGYRQEVTKATLRETLAAALLAFSGWDRTSALLDPFCGSGTIAIEAALLARNIAPGRGRRFAFMDWPGFDASLWRRLLLQADQQVLPGGPPVLASDRDAGAVAIARANAERAGVLEHIDLSQRALKAVAPPPGPLQIVTNPPYGHRLEGGGDLRNLYASLGNLVRGRPGTRLTFISSNPRWTGNTGLRFELGPRLANGSIPIRFARALDAPAPDDRRLWSEAGKRGLQDDDLLIVVDVGRQEARVWQHGRKLRSYPVSTARRGVGAVANSFMTPPGWHDVAERIGGGLPAGSVFKGRVHTGRVVPADGWRSPRAAGDTILTRILWLRGLEEGVNRGPGLDSHDRHIYIHGTIHEEAIGHPASAGCVRMNNRDIVELFDLVGDRRAHVWIG